jgi:hypothetical protein
VTEREGNSALSTDAAGSAGSVKRATLYQEIDGTKYEVALPLASTADVKLMMEELGLPSFIDLEYLPMRSAIVVAWASQKAPELHKRFPQAFDKEASSKPISALLFGGGAIKAHCESSNRKGVLSRTIKDTDFIVPKSQGSSFCKMLLNIYRAFGTEFKFFKTKADTLFNGMRQGQRYRVRTINGVTAEGLPTATVLDIFCDCIDLRHKIEVKDAFEHCRDNLYTIGLELLVMSKCQFIMDFPRVEAYKLKEHDQEYRVLPYSYYAADKLVLGMEEKDTRDVCAVFLDHPIGVEKEQIDAGKMRRLLEKDKKMALSVALNLQNLAARTELLDRWLKSSEVSLVVDRIQTLVGALPKVDKKWSKPWWNTAVETPKVG